MLGINAMLVEEIQFPYKIRGLGKYIRARVCSAIERKTNPMEKPYDLLESSHMSQFTLTKMLKTRVLPKSACTAEGSA